MGPKIKHSLQLCWKVKIYYNMQWQLFYIRTTYSQLKKSGWWLDGSKVILKIPTLYFSSVSHLFHIYFIYLFHSGYPSNVGNQQRIIFEKLYLLYCYVLLGPSQIFSDFLFLHFLSDSFILIILSRCHI